jgi:cytoplasmic iron level regulating protein YaaA (DUF328/UPF0246 family)
VNAPLIRGMLAVISPAKNLSLEAPPTMKGATLPALLEHAAPVARRMAALSKRRLAELLEISPELAQLNHQRYQEWGPPFDGPNAVPAAYLFNGETYRGLATRTLTADDLRFAQHHLRILSGLYGVLRPLDRVQPYRLMMGTPLAVGRKKDLYAYWRGPLTAQLAADLKDSGSNVLINLASAEYFKAVDMSVMDARVITPVFKDKGPRGYRMVMVYAKQQRGAMARHIIRNRLMEPEALKAYDGDGYRFSPADSTAHEWVFLRG